MRVAILHFGQNRSLAIDCFNTNLLWNFPHALHTAEQVAAPQHDAPNVTSEPTLGTASRGSDNRAPMIVLKRPDVVETTKY